MAKTHLVRQPPAFKTSEEHDFKKTMSRQLEINENNFQMFFIVLS